MAQLGEGVVQYWLFAMKLSFAIISDFRLAEADA